VTSGHPIVIVGEYGTLTVTSITSGQAHYTYLETAGAQMHDNAQNDNNILDLFTVSAIDIIGQMVTQDSVLTVRITDGTPWAIKDQNTITEDDVPSVDGNVLFHPNPSRANDLQRPDGAIVTGIFAGTNDNSLVTVAGIDIEGTYGSLNISSDGAYVYTLDNSNPLVQELDGEEHKEDIFTYTITDSDGDTSSTTLGIRILGVDEHNGNQRVLTSNVNLAPPISESKDELENKQLTIDSAIDAPEDITSARFNQSHESHDYLIGSLESTTMIDSIVDNTTVWLSGDKGIEAINGLESNYDKLALTELLTTEQGQGDIDRYLSFGSSDDSIIVERDVATTNPGDQDIISSDVTLTSDISSFDSNVLNTLFSNIDGNSQLMTNPSGAIFKAPESYHNDIEDNLV